MANINTVINELKTKYNITNSTTEQELLELLNVVTVDEINAIKATSVIPLPNVVKGSPQELKERFVNIVADESRGIANVINTRMGLLRIFLTAYMEVETLRLSGKVNYSDILNVLNSTATDKALSANMGRALQEQLDNLTIGTARLEDGAVTEDKIASAAVSGSKIKGSAITTDKIADDSITNDKVKVNAIHTRNIKNGDITFDKLAQEVINYIDGIASGNSIFRGHFESVADLPAYSAEIQLHNNDYAYVTTEVEDEETHEINPELSRYKYSEGQWVFEYIIPNTSFSASEWEAIKSGITSTLVSKLMGIETGAEVNVQPDWTQSDNTKDDYIKNKPNNLMTTDTAQEITADKTFKDGAKIKFKNSASDVWTIRKNGSTMELHKDNDRLIQLTGTIMRVITLLPNGGTETLGNSTNFWKHAYISGNIYNNNNQSFSVSDFYDKPLHNDTATIEITPSPSYATSGTLPQADSDKLTGNLTSQKKVIRLYYQNECFYFVQKISSTLYFQARSFASSESGYYKIITPTITINTNVSPATWEYTDFEETSYYNKSEIDTKFSNVYTKTETNTLLGNKENTSNKTTSLSSSSTDTEYPSAKAVYDNEKAISDRVTVLEGRTWQPQYLTGTAKSVLVPNDAFPTGMLTMIGGKSYKVNQLVQNGNFSSSSYWSVDGTGTLTVSGNIATFTAEVINTGLKQSMTIKGSHKYLACASIQNTNDDVIVEFRDGEGIVSFATYTHSSSFTRVKGIATAVTNNTSGYFRIRNLAASGWSDTSVKDVVLFDLTEMGIDTTDVSVAQAELLKRGIDINTYTAYTTGAIRNLALTGVKVVGTNIWDEQWEVGAIDLQGQNATSTVSLRSKNYCKIKGNTTYYFTHPTSRTGYSAYIYWYDSNENFISYASNNISGAVTSPSNAYYFKICLQYYIADYSTYNHDICINVSASALNGKYYSHKETTLPIDLSTILYNGNPLYEENAIKGINGVLDTVEPTKAVKRIGRVDLGSLNWTYVSPKRFYTPDLASIIATQSGSTDIPNLLCAMYIADTWENVYDNNGDMIMSLNPTGAAKGYLSILNSNYTDAAAFKTAMSGVYLYFELATPITVALNPELYNPVLALEHSGTVSFENTNDIEANYELMIIKEV